MEGRCKDCTLDEKLEKLQVLRLIKSARRDGCRMSEREGGCTLYNGKKKTVTPDKKDF